MQLEIAIQKIAPLYNLGLVLVALYLFIKLFKTPKHDRRVFTKPWHFIFFAMLVFTVEEIFTVLWFLVPKAREFIPANINGFFELVMIIVFIYALLIQKEYNKKK